MSLIPEPVRLRFVRLLDGCPDDTVLRWLFGAILTATVTVVALDYREMYRAAPQQQMSALPDLPSAMPEPLAPMPRHGRERTVAPLRPLDKQLSATMTFDLRHDGRLLAVGTIAPGTAKAFALEIGKRGSYVKAVVLHSPGGSVQDALAMGRLIREKKFFTEVEAGGYCASSCPLVFAGGIERRAGANAAIGVHQVSAPGVEGLSVATGMDQAQRISAQCQKYLRDMGIDLEVWLHAMETPKEKLFYLKPDELLRLKLATENVGDAPVRRAKS